MPSDDEPPEPTEATADAASDRVEPVGEPVVRGDPEITGQRADEAIAFDPDDPDSLARATDTVREFAAAETGDNVFMLRGAAACAALVRGEGSYRAAAERAGEDVTVEFVRTWARVHDLPISIRRRVAAGDIAPSAATHIARVSGNARFLLAWAILDHDLTVHETREIASAVTDGTPIGDALRERGIDPGEIEIRLAEDTYRELYRRAAIEGTTPDDLVSEALRAHLDVE